MPETPDATQALRRALERASLANRLLLHLALRADAEGRPSLARALRDAATGETGRAFEHLDWLARLGAEQPSLDVAVAALLDTLAGDARAEAASAAALRGEPSGASSWLQRASAARGQALERLRAALAEKDRGA